MEKVRYGVRNCHYATATHTAAGSVFGPLKPWEGMSAISLPPVGTPLKVFGDDVTWFTVSVNQGYDGNITAHQVPNDYRINHMGEYKDENGVMVERSSAQPLTHAIVGEFQTADEMSVNPKRWALYNCTAGRADFSGTTKTDSIEVASYSIPITVAPTPADELVKATILKSDNEAIFNSWLSSVYYNPGFISTQRVSLTVTNGTIPIVGAIVVVGEKIAKTNADGVALFALPAGTYDVFASASGHVAEVDSITVASTAVTQTLTLTEV